MILGVLVSLQIRPIAQTNPANSRATAVAATVVFFPRITRRVNFLYSLSSAFLAVSMTSGGCPSRRFLIAAPVVRGECR